MNNNTVIIHITIHATIWRSTSPAWIVCAQTRTASEGYWACQWCGLSAGDQRQIGQRRWVQIGDDDIGKPDSNQSGVPVVHATQYRRCNQPLTNWRFCSFAYGALQIRLLLLLLLLNAGCCEGCTAQRNTRLNLRPHGQVSIDKEPKSCTIVQQWFNCYCRETIENFLQALFYAMSGVLLVDLN